MRWNDLQQFPNVLVIPTCFALGAGYVFSHAVLKGIACARDEHNRVTPEDPWVFFDREYAPRARLFACCLVPWILLSMVINWRDLIRLNFVSSKWDWDTRMETFGAYVPQDFLSTIGIIGFLLTSILFLAPRFKNPLLLTITALIPGTIISFPIQLLLIYDTIDPNTILTLLLSSCSITIYFSAWLYIRHKLNHAWFRFDD